MFHSFGTPSPTQTDVDLCRASAVCVCSRSCFSCAHPSTALCVSIGVPWFLRGGRSDCLSGLRWVEEQLLSGSMHNEERGFGESCAVYVRMHFLSPSLFPSPLTFYCCFSSVELSIGWCGEHVIRKNCLRMWVFSFIIYFLPTRACEEVR